MKTENKMLEGYFGVPDAGVSVEQWKRYLAVQAALEIARASVGSTFNGSFSKVGGELESVSKNIDGLADAIQQSLDK